MKKFYSFLFGLVCVSLLLPLAAQAQQTDRQPTLTDIAQEGLNPDFFVIKPELNLTKEEFIKTYLSVLNLTPGSTMEFVREETDEIGMTHSRYQQFWNGHRVKGGEMVIHQQKGRIKYINGRYMTALPLNTQVLISEEAGLQTALQQINSTKYNWLDPEAEANYKKVKKNPEATLYPHGELVFIPERGNQRFLNFMLAWKYSVNVTPATESYEVYINATTGEVLNKIPLTLSCSGGSSTTIWNGVRTIYTQLNAGTYRTLGDCNSAQIHTMNGNGNDNGVGATYYTDADNSWPNTTLGNYIAQTHWGVKETRDYYAVVHGREGYDDLGHDYTSYINPGFTGNAYWTYATEAASFGGSSTGTSPYCNIDVCGHEHTHGVVHFTSDLVYQDEPGALNESFADCLGEAVEVRTLGTTNWIHRFEISGGNRSLINPNAFSDPDTYQGTFWYTGAGDFGGVHTNSGVQNYWFYLLSDGGSGTNDNGNAFSVTGIGINKARMIAYQTMISLTTNSQYADARAVSIQAAKDLYGNCSDEAEATTRAWYAVGVGANWVTPTPLNITVSTSANYICPGSSATVTAFGAIAYTWTGGTGIGNPQILSPVSTTTYTVTGTDAEACTGTKSFTIDVTPAPTVTPTADDNDICEGASTTVRANTNGTLQNLTTPMLGGNGFAANAFDIQAYNSITITDFQMNIVSGDSAVVYYKPGGYGNANVTDLTTWFKLGQTVAITPAGAGNQTLIPTTSNLTIPAGQTYGIIVACNGSNDYTNGTLVGSTLVSNADLRITQGHGGSVFGSVSFPNAPRNFNGQVIYRTNFTSYSWSPSSTLSSATSSLPTATPTTTTTYTLTATDGNGCTGTGTVTVYVNDLPTINSISATPESICQASSSNLSVSATSLGYDNLLTAFNSNNNNSGNAFDVTAIKDLSITALTINAGTGTQAEVWYKPGGYGGVDFFSNAGWTKVGNTVNITPAGQDLPTYVYLTSPLAIPAGQTYGIVVVTNGILYYTNGTAVGAVLASNPDLNIFQGHGGTGFGGSFNFGNSPRNFNGRIYYDVDHNITSYTWSPSVYLTGSNTATPVASPTSSTSYTVTVTDGNGCTNSEIQRVYVGEPLEIQVNSASTSVCPGASQAISTANMNAAQSDEILTRLNSDNGYGPNGGVVFDVTTTRAITITSVKMNVDDGATQAEVWYKSGGYGGANLTSNVGWTKLGATVAITSQGQDNFTTIPITANLNIPANTTYGLAIVCNGNVNYINGTSVGAVYTAHPGISIKQGHGGAGFGGTFNFINNPRVFSGSLVYNETVNFSSYAWTPNSTISNTTVSNPTVSPTTNTSYSVTVTDANGCTGTASFGVQVMDTPTGTATASPSSACVGSAVSLNYSPLAGSQCNGVVQSGFTGTYAPATWSTVLTNSNGTVNTAGAPASIVMTSSNGLTGSGITAYQHSITCSGYLKFNWSYTTTDGPQYDYPRYTLNGGAAQIFPGYKSALGNANDQAGTFSLPVNAGDIVQIQMYSSDNVGGAGSLTLSSFKAPYQTATTQTVAWYTVATGGASLSAANPYSYIPAAGNYTYYAQVTNSTTGCTNASRVATNAVTIDPLPSVSISPASAAICNGGSTNLTASGALSYSWQPGSLTGSSVNVAPTTTTTYTVTGTSAAGCTATSTVTVTVNPLPVIAGSASPSIVCPGSPVTLTGTTPGVTWNWQPGNLSGSPVVVNPVVQTTYTVTATSAQGCTAAQTFVILMHPVPTVNTTVSPSATICSGQTATITATGGSTYLWQPGGTTGATRNVTTSGTYTVTATNAQGCTASTTRTITVNPLPVVTASSTGLSICNGSSTTLNASGASTYTWQPGGLTGSSVVVSPSGTTTYTVTGTSAAGCTSVSDVTIVVHPLPTANAGADGTTTCSTPTMVIGTAGVIGFTYSWSPATGLSSTTAAQPTANPASTTTYTLTVTSIATGCTATDQVVVTVNKSAPVADAGLDKTNTCTTPTNAIGTAAVGGVTYAWLPAAGLSATNVAQPTANPASTTTYTVTATNSANGCTATDAVLVTVNKTAPTANAGADKTNTCSTPTNTIGTAAVGGVTYAWLPATGLSATNVAQPTANPASTTTYTVTATNSANGCTATDAVLVTVNKTAPTANAGADKTNNCTTPSNTIGTAAVGGVTYAWLPATGLSATNVAQPTANPASTTTYTVTATNSANGCTATDAVIVTVDKTPPTVSTSATSTTICSGSSTTLSATGASTYTWQPGGLTGSSVVVSPTSTTTYTVTGTNAAGCTNTATRLITVNTCGNGVLTVKAYNQGYYIGGGSMAPVLMNQGQPGGASDCDTVEVRLHNATAPYAAVQLVKGVMPVNGSMVCTFPPAVVGNSYYISLRHRNSIETWSANPVTMSTSLTYDFTTAASQAYGSNQMLVDVNKYAVYNGDVNQDGVVDGLDYNDWELDNNNFAAGYFSTDFNGDGIVDGLDFLIWEVNNNNFVGMITP